MTSKEIRKQFLDFFASKEHTIVESSAVVPLDDPTLMFTNAGMNQFKDVFLATGSRPYVRVADTQKCIRAGGKHNDLDDVGQDTYHHTFFEMLGNWSFGDYFKKEAIEWAWELLSEVWGIEKDRLHATYFEGDAADGLKPDTEAEVLWKTVTDIDPFHVHPGGKKDNFWEMGETGPCGPCSEIHVDLTPDKSGAKLVNAGDPRVIELWNLVFIQFNRDSAGNLTPLPAKHVDTGMGLERLVAVLKGTVDGRLGEVNNYDTDVFTPIFDAIQKRTGAPPYRGTLPEPRSAGGELRMQNSEFGIRHSTSAIHQVMIDVSYRVIADHVRCLTFALTDGAIPSNEGRGYVLRRILRRAVRYGRQYMDMHEPFVCDLVKPLVEHMAGAFPELNAAHGGKNLEHVTELVCDEEASFGKTLDRGIRLFARARAEAVGRAYAEHKGDLIFGGIGSFGAWGGEDATPCWEKAMQHVGFTRESTKEVLELATEKAATHLREAGATATISGKDAFRLHDTYGFPIDLTQQMADEQGLSVDIKEYERLMEKARKRSVSFEAKAHIADNAMFFTLLEGVRGQSRFVGYERLQNESGVSTLLGLDQNGEITEVDAVCVGKEAYVVLAETPFYPEQGGQIGDRGRMVGIDSDWVFQVDDTQRVHETILHHGRCVTGQLKIALPSAAKTGGPSLSHARAEVDTSRRCATMSNHTSTHLLNWALREVLGKRVQQKGSLVDPERTRFDLSHKKPLTPEELERVESLVNQRIDEDLEVFDEELPLEVAQRIKGSRDVFGEKYPDPVRVISIGKPLSQFKGHSIKEIRKQLDDEDWLGYSVEFCGGTHLTRTGEAERFVLTSEEAVAKGIRRVVGITGEAARRAIELGKELLAEAEALAGGSPVSAPSVDPYRDREGAIPSRGLQPARTSEDLGVTVSTFQQKVSDATIPIRVRHELHARIAKLQEKAKKQQKKAASASGEVVMDRVASLLESAETVGGVTVVVGEVPAAPVEALRGAIDWVRNKTEASAVLLALVVDDKVTLVSGMSKSVVAKGIKAGDLIKEIAPLVGGKGGGRPDMAQGGGSDPSGLADALTQGRALMTRVLS